MASLASKMPVSPPRPRTRPRSPRPPPCRQWARHHVDGVTGLGGQGGEPELAGLCGGGHLLEFVAEGGQYGWAQ